MRVQSGASSGALNFARFALPPNALGLCGPDATAELTERIAAGPAGPASTAGPVDPDLRALLRGFEGAWPYLELIAAHGGIADPLDGRVVEAYWIGGPLLAQVAIAGLGESLRDRFARRLPRRDWCGFADSLPTGALAHHGTHVLLVYPWVGLLRGGSPEALHVLDRCRIRWAQVLSVLGEMAVVRGRPLAWDGNSLSLGPPGSEQVRLVPGLGGAGPMSVRPGDWVACHWDWACVPLTLNQRTTLRAATTRTLAEVNSAPGTLARLEG